MNREILQKNGPRIWRVWKSKALWLILSAAAAAFVLNGCSGIPAPKNESELREDIPAEYRTITLNNFGNNKWQKFPLAVSELVIDKRQTNKEDKKDLVYCTAELSDAEGFYSATVPYYMEYTYYDEGGWILSDIQYDGCDSIPLRLDISDTSKAPTAIWDCIKTYNFDSIELAGFTQTGTDTFLATFEVSQGIAWISGEDVPVQCAGTIDLECEFSESRADNTFDWDFTANEHLAPVEDEFLHTITNVAHRLYSSAVYKESYFDPDTNGTCYEFEVNEQHKYCDISGVVTFQVNIVREPGEISEKKLFLRINECEDSAVDVDWKILGDWTTEFVDHNYVGSYGEETEIWKLNFSISAVSGAEVVLSDASYSYALKKGLYNSMAEMGDTPNFYQYDLTSEYVPCRFYDGALCFSPEINTAAQNMDWGVKVSFDYAEVDFSYLSKPYQELLYIGD